MFKKRTIQVLAIYYILLKKIAAIFFSAGENIGKIFEQKKNKTNKNKLWIAKLISYYTNFLVVLLKRKKNKRIFNIFYSVTNKKNK